MNTSSTPPLAINLLVLVGLVAAFLWLLSTVGVQQQSSALSGSDFNPGRIIDDEIFFDDRAMTTSQIQQFLDARMTNCDENGSRSITYHYRSNPLRVGNSNDPTVTTSRATYGQRFQNYWESLSPSVRNPVPPGSTAPYTCLNDYTEQIPSISNSGSDLCTGSISGGNKSAAQIIHDVGRACGINPQVLIVMLQKEQSLITDTWPWQRQYDTAMGYACPDSGPNNSANCNSNFFGFFNQVYNAAQAFKRYEANPGNYNYRAGRNNNILYHPNTSCGSSSVFIENQATANLYIYTPYQPNRAALDNLYGHGDSCSAYGNRNFWRMFNDWFGSTRYSIGSVHLIREHDRWRSSWDQIVPLDINGNGATELVFYDKSNRSGEIYRVNSSGRLSTIARSSGWRATWDQIVPIDINGNGRNELLFYDSSNRTGEIYRVSASGDLSLISRHTTWRATWDQILPIDINGNSRTELLFYDSSNRTGEIYRVNTSGRLELTQNHNSWRSSWDQILPININGDNTTELLFYDSSNRTGAIYNVGSSGGLRLIRQYNSWRSSWDQILPININGDNTTELLFYDSDSRTGAMYNVNSSGRLSGIREHTTWRRTWDQILSTDIYGDNTTELLFYDSNNRTGAFYRIDG